MKVELDGVSVLVLAHDPVRRQAMSTAFTRANAKVRALASAEAALPIVILDPVDVIVCVLDASGSWSSIEWISTLRALPYPSSSDVLAIAVGDHAIWERVLQPASNERLFDELVSTPVTPMEVVARVCARVRGSAAA